MLESCIPHFLSALCCIFVRQGWPVRHVNVNRFSFKHWLVFHPCQPVWVPPVWEIWPGSTGLSWAAVERRVCGRVLACRLLSALVGFLKQDVWAFWEFFVCVVADCWWTNKSSSSASFIQRFPSSSRRHEEQMQQQSPEQSSFHSPLNKLQLSQLTHSKMPAKMHKQAWKYAELGLQSVKP